jgi:hypothetical protein
VQRERVQAGRHTGLTDSAGRLVQISMRFHQGDRSIDGAHFRSVMLASTLSSRSSFTAATILQLIYTPMSELRFRNGVNTKCTEQIDQV